MKRTYREFDWDVDEDREEMTRIENDPTKKVLWRHSFTFTDRAEIEDPVTKAKKMKMVFFVKIILLIEEPE